MSTTTPQPRAAGPAPKTPAQARRVTDRLALSALGLVVLDGALRVYWQFGHMPERLSPIGPDLVVFTGWGAVALLATAALILTTIVTVRLSGPSRRLLLIGAWAVSIALIVAGALLLLDIVGALVPGMGIDFYPLGALSKGAVVASGILLGRAAQTYQRRTRPTGVAPGRIETWWTSPLSRTPIWAMWAAYIAVAGTLVRIIAQAGVGFSATPLTGGVAHFEIGFILGGTLLPLALVHTWGRIWPRWVPGLAGRPVPRRLVLWPAAGISGALIVYFGLFLLQMIVDQLILRNPFPSGGGATDPPEAFYWFAVPGYLTWGVGMAIATLAYARRTRSGDRHPR